MSKKLLKDLSEKTEQEIVKFNKGSATKAKYGGIRVKKLNKDEIKAFTEAVEDGDTKKVVELFDTGVKSPTELYFSLPDLKVSDSGSIQKLSVYAYSTETKDEVLLHKLFSHVRDQG